MGGDTKSPFSWRTRISKQGKDRQPAKEDGELPDGECSLSTSQQWVRKDAHQSLSHCRISSMISSKIQGLSESLPKLHVSYYFDEDI